MFDFTKHFSTKTTTQREPIPGTDQVANSAGGFTWQLDDWARLDRFLILGSEDGTFYIKERELTRENAAAVMRCIAADGIRTINRIVAISDTGRAPKNDPAIFSLAMASKLGDEQTRRAAYAALPKVCRTGTHLMHFAAYAQAFGGWGRGMRRAVGSWFNARPATELALQLAKYQQRDGWSHRDLLRLAHPKAASPSHDRLFRWTVSGELPLGASDDKALELIVAMHALRRITDVASAAWLIIDKKLPRECVPTELLRYPEIWEALLPAMPMTAMIRNLATMTRVGLLTQTSDATAHVTSQLRDASRLKKARIHPIAILAALMTYKSGRGARGTSSWQPVAKIVDALDAAFYASFAAVEPSNKRTLLPRCLGLDVRRHRRWRPRPDSANRECRHGARHRGNRARPPFRGVLRRHHHAIDLAAAAARRCRDCHLEPAIRWNRLRPAHAVGAEAPRRRRHVRDLHRLRDLGGPRAPVPSSAGLP